MVDLEYVKKKKKRKIAFIVSAVCSASIAALIIISFIGNAIGTFTVSLKKFEEVKIVMSEHSDFKVTSTYLHLSNVPKMDIYTANMMTDHDQIDNENNDYLYGAQRDEKQNPTALNYLKYTFFLKNEGINNINYNFKVNVLKNVPPSSKSGEEFDYDLTDISRVRVYENKDEKHSYKTYAKKSRTSHINEKGETTYQEPIAGDIDTIKYCGFAEQYISSETFVSISDLPLAPNEIVRYTVVIWLEGEDPQTVGAPPDSCSLELGVDISAYEGKVD